MPFDTEKRLARSLFLIVEICILLFVSSSSFCFILLATCSRRHLADCRVQFSVGKYLGLVFESGSLETQGSILLFRFKMASANPAPVGTEKRHPEEKLSAEGAPASVAPEVTRFPKDVDGASHGSVWKDVGVPLRADPANNPNSDEWDQAKQAFKDTGLLKRVTSELG